MLRDPPFFLSTTRYVAVTVAHVEAAKETIILERRSHADSLAARLHEDRVRRGIEPLLAIEPEVSEKILVHLSLPLRPDRLHDGMTSRTT